MGSIFKAPKMPPPPPIIEPKVEDVPDAEDEERAAEEEAELRARNRKRKGRRSTILTSPDYEEVEADTDQKTLLGG